MMQAMKERPILFSAPMVRAIHEGRKTQTRRVVKPQPYIDKNNNFCWNGCCYGQDFNGPLIQALASPIPSSKTNRVICPYGKPGDQLWVRETFDPIYPQDPNYNGGLPIEIDYAATPRERMKDHHGMRKWKPSIHMPRWASRIQLEITGIRVERLQDCSETDADAEGCPFDQLPLSLTWYAELWESINGPGSWDTNPWVWVVEFKVLKP